MRISTKEFYLSGLQAVQQHTSDILRAQRQIATGEKYNNASDSPLAAGMGVQLVLDHAQFDMFKVNQDFTNAKLAESDTQLKALADGIQRIRQLMVQAGNDLAPDQRSAIKLEVEQIWERMKSFAAVKDSSGNNLFPQVSPSEVPSALIAPETEVRGGVSFSEIMGRMAPSQPTIPPSLGFVDAYPIMDHIIAVLDSGQSPSSSDWTDFEKVSSQVNQASVKIGVLQNHLDAASESADTQRMNIEVERSHLLDADLAATTSELAKSNALLQAAQSIMSRIDINNLFQKL